MAGPATDEERRVAARRVGAGFAAVVAVSAGMIAVQSGASLQEAGMITLAGLVFGVALIVVLVRRW